MKMRVKGIESRCCRRAARLTRSDRKGGIGNRRHRLVDSILVNGLDEVRRSCIGTEAVGHREPLIEPSISAAQNGLWRLLRVSVTKSVGERNPRAPIALVVDAILRLPPQSIAEGEALVNLPVILVEKCSIEQNRPCGVLVYVGYLVGIRSVVEILRTCLKCVLAVGAAIGIVRVPIG